MPRDANGSRIKVSILSSMLTTDVTIQEAMTFLSNPDVDFEISQVDFINTKTDTCNVGNGIPEGCKHVFGDLKIGQDNEHLVSRLKSVEVLFGGLLISRTSLTTIDFFDNLKYILLHTSSMGAFFFSKYFKDLSQMRIYYRGSH